ncbi:MAG: calcium/sodium antiporter [Thermodesulfovibrionales bacterium]|nr:calcium/sodium antiporter [Thermodesulfovibrionales bacterium]
MNEYFYMLIGLIFAGIGGELFVRGAVGIAHWARISPGIIGATIAAFGTSSPELSVAVNSGLTSQSDIALGDALGSNLLNVALILGVALCISGIQSPRESLKRDFPVALFIAVITGIFAFDGIITRFESIILLFIFIVWFVLTVIDAHKQRSFADDIIGEHRGHIAIILSIIGLILLIFAGKFIVMGAGNIAESLGIDKFIIGATIVAIGTSTPELATTVIAKIKGHDEVGLGTILGSNIFNGAFIISVAGIISPIKINPFETFVTVIFGVVTLIIAYPSKNGFIKRRTGFVLIVMYALYIFILWLNK